MPASFVHLRLHTEYSLVDGLVRIKPLVKTLVGMNMPAVAVTDQNNMCSLVKFYKNAMGAGIKPICGADLWLSNKDPDNPLSRISLLAMNGVGYRNLTELISRGFIDGQRNGSIIIEREWVAEANEGLIMLSAAKEGEIGMAMIGGNPAEAEALLKKKSLSTPFKTDKAWHVLTLVTEGDELRFSLDGKLIAKHRSEGYAHDPKRWFSFLVGSTVWIDDVKIYKVR